MTSLFIYHNVDADLSAQQCCYCDTPVMSDAIVVYDSQSYGIAHNMCHLADMQRADAEDPN